MPSTMRSLFETFPDHPDVPSLQYAAGSALPLTIPWTKAPIQLGVSFQVPLHGQAKFLNCSAFAPESLACSHLCYTPSSCGSLVEATTFGSGHASEHVDVSGQAQIGGTLLGASGQAQYETHATGSRSQVQNSLRTEYHRGTITFVEIPRLSSEALSLLRSHDDPHRAFREKYGDYYVGAFIVGAANATLVSGTAASAARAMDLSGTVEAHFLFVKASVDIGKHEYEQAASGMAGITAHDSLDDWQEHQTVASVSQYEEVMRMADMNRNRGLLLSHRVGSKVEQFQLERSGGVQWQQCEDLCRSGLVVKLLLLPYISLRDYAAAFMSQELSPEH